MATDTDKVAKESLAPSDEEIITQINEEIVAAMRTWKRRFIERLRQLENDPRRVDPQ